MFTLLVMVNVMLFALLITFVLNIDVTLLYFMILFLISLFLSINLHRIKYIVNRFKHKSTDIVLYDEAIQQPPRSVFESLTILSLLSSVVVIMYMIYTSSFIQFSSLEDIYLKYPRSVVTVKEVKQITPEKYTKEYMHLSSVPNEYYSLNKEISVYEISYSVRFRDIEKTSLLLLK